MIAFWIIVGSAVIGYAAAVDFSTSGVGHGQSADWLPAAVISAESSMRLVSIIV